MKKYEYCVTYSDVSGRRSVRRMIEVEDDVNGYDAAWAALFKEFGFSVMHELTEFVPLTPQREAAFKREQEYHAKYVEELYKSGWRPSV